MDIHVEPSESYLYFSNHFFGIEERTELDLQLHNEVKKLDRERQNAANCACN